MGVGAYWHAHEGLLSLLNVTHRDGNVMKLIERRLQTLMVWIVV